jgi:ketosteroid isomerase-like protein
MEAMAKKDIRKLNELIADDLIYTHSSARLDTKQSLIGNMESGSTVYTSVVPSDVKAQDLGDTVVLTGSCKISVMSGGKPNSFGVRFTDVWANKGGRWQMVTWQSTRTPD